MDKIISVILPTYNSAKTIEKAINSVINQTFINWELLIIDNYSNDGTEQVINKFIKDRITLYKINNNNIIAKSRNYGINKAKGKYIAFLDSDDWWFPNKLQDCYNFINKSDCITVCHGEKWLYENKSFKNVYYGPKNKSDYYSLLYNGNCISTSAVVIKKEALLSVNCFSEKLSFISAEDYDLWLKLADFQLEFEFYKKVLGVFNIHEESSSSSEPLKHTNAILSVVQNHYDKNQKNLSIRIKKKKRFSEIWRRTGKKIHWQGKYKDALFYYYNAVKLYPFSIKLITLILSLLIPIRIIHLFNKVKFSKYNNENLS